MALVKIAYGIAIEVEGEDTQRLLVSTRAMGIYDFKAADSIGTVFKLAMGNDKEGIANSLSKVFLFDIFSPWAMVSELNSTHPLTGKRIKALSRYAKELGIVSIFDFEKVVRDGEGLDKGRLYHGFFEGMVICALPFLAVLAGVLITIGTHSLSSVSILMVLLGVSLLMQGLYKFGRQGDGLPEKTTVFELMQDPYANPLKGRFVEIEGKVIGKADAGSYLGEDVKMQDKSGCLVYLNYESVIPILGNIIFGLGKAKKMIGQYSKASGWFRRSSFQVVDLDTVEVSGDTIKSYTRLWGIIAGILLLILGVFFFIVVAGKSCPLA
jgi:hypothetical protein